jgi:hypothetical protein
MLGLSSFVHAAPAPPKPPVSNPTATASRFVKESELTPYLTTISTTFSMRGRPSDPFCLLQDPSAKPVIKASVTKSSRRTAPIQATPFSDILKRIKVTTIMPKEQRFLIGTRSVKQGDRIPLAFRGKTIHVEITSVTSREIEFRNLDNGESAALKLNILPVGMTPGSRTLTAPGMTPARPDAPIELDASS